MTTGTESSGSDAGKGTRGRFQETLWSVVLKARDWRSPDSHEAFTRLYKAYFDPLYVFIRARVRSAHEAEELTQAFFCFLLRKDVLQKADPGRGRFRSFLLASLNHFLADERDRQQAQKRGGGQSDFSFDVLQAEQRYQIEMMDGETPETLFERRWAIAVLDAAMARLEGEFASAGKGPLFRQLAGFLVDGAERRPYAEVAAELGMSEDAARKAVQRLRRSFRKAIRDEIAETVASPGEIDGELRHLFAVLSS